MTVTEAETEDSGSALPETVTTMGSVRSGAGDCATMGAAKAVMTMQANTQQRNLNERDFSPPWQRRGGRAGGAVGVVRSTSSQICAVVDGTTPSAPSKVASRHFIDGAATPPLPRRGIRLVSQSLQILKPGDRCQHSQSHQRRSPALPSCKIHATLSPMSAACSMLWHN